MKKMWLVAMFAAGFALSTLGCATQPSVVQGSFSQVDPDQPIPIITTIKTEVDYVGLREIGRGDKTIVYEWSAIIVAWKPGDGGAKPPTQVDAIGTLLSGQGNKLGESRGTSKVTLGKKPYVTGKVSLTPDQAKLVQKVSVTAGYLE